MLWPSLFLVLFRFFCEVRDYLPAVIYYTIFEIKNVLLSNTFANFGFAYFVARDDIPRG
jgi:hypothetical protein